MNEETGAATPIKQWTSKNLVTLGSAAVFSVYSAGYYRTREAADRFADESVQRHAAPVAPAASNVSTAAPRNHIEGNEAQKLAVIKPSSSTAKQKSLIDPSSAPAVGAPAAPAVAVAEPVPAPPVSAPTVSSAPPAAPAPAPDSAAEQKKPERVGLKDGTFYGWGTSRHGDIQASIEILDGKITAAYISQCRTQYSCSWISLLPPQVVSRQSAEVDYVSGATQSSNAFYYAVAAALKSAK